MGQIKESDLYSLVVPGLTGADPEVIKGPDVGGAAYCWMYFVCHNREGISICPTADVSLLPGFHLLLRQNRPPTETRSSSCSALLIHAETGGLECFDTSVFPEKLLHQQNSSPNSAHSALFCCPFQ